MFKEGHVWKTCNSHACSSSSLSQRARQFLFHQMMLMMTLCFVYAILFCLVWIFCLVDCSWTIYESRVCVFLSPFSVLLFSFSSTNFKVAERSWACGLFARFLNRYKLQGNGCCEPRAKVPGGWCILCLKNKLEQGAVTDPQLARTFAILELNFNGRGERASISA